MLVGSRRVWFAIVILAIIGALWLGDWVTHLPFAAPVLQGDLTSVQTKQIDIHVETIKLLITLATLLFGGVGFALGIANNRRAKPGFLVALGAWSAGFSIYCGYIALNMMAWMLSKRFFDLDTAPLHRARQFQFGFFVLSLSVLCFLLFDVFESQKEQR